MRVLIGSKAPLTNLFYMLTYAYDLPAFGTEETLCAVGEDLFEFVVRIFVGQVDKLLRQGLYRAYVEHDEEETYLRGRLKLTDQVRRSGPGSLVFSQTLADLTADVLHNRILKAALARLARLDYSSRELKQQLRRSLTTFSDVALTSIMPTDWDSVCYTRLNARYESAVNLARLLLHNLSPEGNEGGVRFASYLLDMNQVFELFVARYLVERYRSEGELRVDIQPTIWLDEDQKEKGRPDVILRAGQQRVLVLDTKHKRFDGWPDEHDRNSMVMYCHSLRAVRAVLIYSGGVSAPYDGRFGTVGLSSDVLRLDGGLGEFRSRCNELASRCRHILLDLESSAASVG